MDKKIDGNTVNKLLIQIFIPELFAVNKPNFRAGFYSQFLLSNCSFFISYSLFLIPYFLFPGTLFATSLKGQLI